MSPRKAKPKTVAWVRCSKIDAALACPSSLLEAEYPYSFSADFPSICLSA